MYRSRPECEAFEDGGELNFKIQSIRTETCILNRIFVYFKSGKEGKRPLTYSMFHFTNRKLPF